MNPIEGLACGFLWLATACAAAWAFTGVTLTALAGGFVLVGALLALSLLRPEALGMGDVKLALLLVLGLDGRGAAALLIGLALAAGSASSCSCGSGAPLLLTTSPSHPFSSPGR